VSSIVDASVVAAYLLGVAGVEERAAMLDDAQAPAILDVEVTQVLRGLLRGGKLDLERAETARIELGQLPIRRHPDASLLRRAWELRDVCTTYDGLYVALAEAFPAPLVTRDGRLARGAGAGAGADIVLTAERE
jgi:predicted nucleic acid-binding protein